MSEQPSPSERSTRTPDEWREANDVAREHRLHLALADMDDVALTARYLSATASNAPGDRHDELPFGMRYVLEAGLFVVYARAFNKSNGDPPLPAAPTSGLTAEQSDVHEWARRRRDQVAAHVDRDAEERQLRALSLTVEDASGLTTLPPDLIEHYRPPSREELGQLADLAETLAARYRELLSDGGA